MPLPVGQRSARSSGEYGSLVSRAKNTHHPDSDLDVAIEIDPVGNDEDVQTSFIADVNRWTCELNHATGLSVDLNHYDDKDNDSKVLGYVDDHGLLVFQRGRRRDDVREPIFDMEDGAPR